MFLGCRCALFVALICAVSGVGPYYVKVGGEVRFKPNPTLSFGNTITWKFRADAGSVIRVIEFDHGASSSPQNPLFKDNAAADKNTGELTLKHVRKDHSGVYYFDINGKEQEQKFTLKVMEEVQQPVLSLSPTSNQLQAMYLECPYNATIIWNCTHKTPPVAVLPNGKIIGESIVFEKGGNPDACCTCTLKNDVSQKTSKPLCEREIFPEGSDLGHWLPIVISIVAVIFLPCVFIALYMCSDYIHDAVREKLGKTPCLGAILNVLDSCRNKKKPKPDSKQDNLTTAYNEVGTTETKGEGAASKGPQHDEDKLLEPEESP